MVYTKTDVEGGDNGLQKSNHVHGNIDLNSPSKRSHNIGVLVQLIGQLLRVNGELVGLHVQPHSPDA